MTRPRQAVILAGGRGRRMRPATDSIPKHMIEFHGRPFLAYLLEQVRLQGFERILLLLGYLPGATRDYFGDGRRHGLSIEYLATPAEFESGARLRESASLLDPVFLLLYCDNYWPLHFLPMWEAYGARGGLRPAPLAQMTVYENTDGYTRSNCAIAQDGRVSAYDATRSAGTTPDGVDIGYILMDRRALEAMPAGNVPLNSLFPVLAAQGRLAAYKTSHRYYSAGSKERLAMTERFLAFRKTVIVDRDGVLNRRPPLGEYVCGPEEFQWLPGALEALRALHQAGFQVLIASNQAGIARGRLTPAALARIDVRMKREAREAGGAITASYYCPHHWEEACGCRKPAPGLLYQAQRDYHLDLTRAWVIGDSESDAGAALAAGSLFEMVTENHTFADAARYVMGGAERAREGEYEEGHAWRGGS